MRKKYSAIILKSKGISETNDVGLDWIPKVKNLPSNPVWFFLNSYQQVNREEFTQKELPKNCYKKF